MRQTGLRFMFFLFFSIFGVIAVMLGYDFGFQSFPFLIFGAVTLFLGFQLLKAFTDPLPAWYTYFSPTSYREPETDGSKTLLRLVYGFIYVWSMTILIGFIFGPKLGFSPERFVFPFLFGVLGVLVLMWFLNMLRALYMFWKDRKSSHSADKV